MAPWICATLLVTGITWFLAVPLELAQLIAQALTTTLVELGEGWLAWVFSPINNIGALLILTVKAIQRARKRIVGVAYARL
jgi:hypothetical protein